MSFLIFGLLGALFVGAGVFDGSDDEGQSDDPTPEELGRELSYDGSDLLEGTEGDDSIPAGLDSRLAPETIDLLGGDDTATIEINGNITVFGGDGDDQITATGVTNVLEGGAGNDTLTADDSNQILGGEGDDVLNFTHGSYDQGDRGVVRGGDGDDTINLRADAIITENGLLNVGGVGVWGGSGSDDFNIVYDLYDIDANAEPADDTISRGFVGLLDFDPSEDSLTIEIDLDAETEARDVTAEIDQTAEEDGTYRSLITLTFEQTDDLAEATNILTVISTAPFTLDDIQLVGF